MLVIAIAVGSIKIDFNTCLYPTQISEHVTTPAARALLSKTLDSVWFGKFGGFKTRKQSEEKLLHLQINNLERIIIF